MEHTAHQAGVLDIAELVDGFVLCKGPSGVFVHGDMMIEAVFEDGDAVLDAKFDSSIDIGTYFGGAHAFYGVLFVEVSFWTSIFAISLLLSSITFSK
jgi:hypothetical protein